VTRRGNWTSKAVSIAAVAAALLSGRLAWAADAADVDELRTEVRRLQADLQALRGAMTEMSEVEQRYAALSKASRGPSAPEPRSAPPVVTEADTGDRPLSPSRVSAAGSDSSARKSKHRRHRQSSRSRAKAGRASASDR